MPTIFGMRELARGLRLAAEAREDLRGLRAGQRLGPDRLQRDDALDQRIVGLVDDAHRAAAELAADFVLADAWSNVRHARSTARERDRARSHARAAGSRNARARYLYFASISHTDFCTSRCTIVSSPAPPCCELLTPSAPLEVAPTSIFSSV